MLGLTGTYRPGTFQFQIGSHSQVNLPGIRRPRETKERRRLLLRTAFLSLGPLIQGKVNPFGTRKENRSRVDLPGPVKTQGLSLPIFHWFQTDLVSCKRSPNMDYLSGRMLYIIEQLMLKIFLEPTLNYKSVLEHSRFLRCGFCDAI